MKIRTGQLSRGPQEEALCILALLVACSFASGQQTARPCSDEFTKPRLEIIHAKEIWESDAIRVRSAIQELGERRCVDAIDDLVGALTFRFPFPKDIHEPGAGLQPTFTGTRYPATSALSQIGTSALPALVEVIETNDEASLVSKNARHTVRSIFLYDPSEADEFFKKAAEKARTPEAKRRLLKALETAKEDFHSD